MDKTLRDDASIFVNREFSWLKFNERVLEESMCTETPLYERLKFIAIFRSNLDEFYMIRVGTLYDQALLTVPILDSKTHMTPVAQLEHIYRRTREMEERCGICYKRVTSELAAEGVSLMGWDALTSDERKYLDSFFEREILPLLSPTIVDTRHPFPFLGNKQIYVAVRLESKRKDEDKKTLFGIIPVSNALPRLVRLQEKEHRFILTEEVVRGFSEKVFNFYSVRESVVFCVTRNADINMDEQFYNQEVDYRAYMKEVLKKRKRLAAVRLELRGDCSKELREYFKDKIRLQDEQIFSCVTPPDMRWVYGLGDHLPDALRKKLSWVPHHARYPVGLSAQKSMIRQIQHGDVLLTFPYDSFRPFVDLIREASADRYVTSIRLTLYRVGSESQLIDSLINAAENGKDVTILLELRARFDEENNLNWAAKLEEAGVRILYGPDGYKVHSKICLITRREKGRVSHITQIGTGNYNEKTTNVYTDYSLMTANPAIAEDAQMLFNNLSTGTLGKEYRTLLVAPYCMRTTLLQMIDGEIEKARIGREADILVKVNSFTDNVLIEALKNASQAGVRVRMVVRGICCILPGLPGLTENISIVSVVGRYLEHSRVYCFGAGNEQRVYISSADFMTRNMQRRVEVAAPVLDPLIARRIANDVETTFLDNVKGRVMHPDGTYTLRVAGEGARIDSQNFFRERAANGNARKIGKPAFLRAAANKLKSLFRKG